MPSPDPSAQPAEPGALEAAAALVRRARRIVALTGAGISTDSGIPDFRGPDGVWTRDPEAEKYSTIGHYLADPAIRRGAWRRRLDNPAWTAAPNAGHRALVDLERDGRLDLVVTQNIDGLHQRAGSGPDRVVEMHGSIREAHCVDCGWRGPMAPVLDRVRSGEEDPRCERCGGILKSTTVFFGEALDPQDIERAHDAVLTADLLLAVGSTLAVFPVAALVPLAAGRGVPVVIVNGGPTEMDHLASARVTGSISELLPRLAAV